MLFGVLLCASVRAEDTWIGDITFTGNTLNKSRSLEKKIKSRRGQPVDSQKLNNDVKALFETGYFDDVTVDVASMNKQDSKKRPLSRVTFTVTERPTIKRIDYKGNKKIRTSSFESKVQSEVDAPFDKFKASLDERAILEHYRDEGYANAQVEHYTSLDPKNKKLILTFFITEGERIMVKSVEIRGTNRFSKKVIQKKMKIRRKKVFKNETLTSDIQNIENFYKNNGHLDVSISSPTIAIDEERNQADIAIDISEGPRYKVGDVSFSGSTIFTEKELKKAVVLKKKKQFNQERLDESLGNISSLYADRGYLRTEVKDEPVRNTENGTVDFKINIVESSVVYVDGIYVDGNTYTKEYVVRREVLLKPGDIFSASKMRRSVEKIYNLGFLEDVQVDVQQPRSPELADIIFTVKDGKPGILSAGAGFSSVDRFVGSLQLQHTNLFGRAQRADVTYEFGARRQNFEIGWTDPWFLGHKMTGGIDLFNTVRRRDFAGQSSAFREKRRGTSLRLGPRLSDDLGLLFSYTLQTTELFDVDGNIKRDLFPTFGVPKEEADTTDSISQVKSSFLSEVSYDTRDNRFDASRGSRSSLAVETSGGPFGGDIHFYKPQFSSAWYFPTFWKFVFSVSARGAWVNHFTPSKDVPSSERFFLGGADTVRGYDNNSIIPRTIESSETGSAQIRQTPGRIYTIFNAEYKFPIVQEKNRTIFQGAFFLDVGGTWLRTQDIDFATGALDKRMKAGAGFGFRFKTPVFPIRLDFAIPLNPRPTDGTRQGDSKSLQPYFTIGNIF
jgi:outer membrane protein insertion porin family